MGDPILRGAVATELERRFNEASTETLHINQSELAKHLGMHRVSVNRAIQAMIAARVLIKTGVRSYKRISSEQHRDTACPDDDRARASHNEAKIITLIEHLIERQDSLELFIRETFADLIARITEIEQRQAQALQTIAELAKGVPLQRSSSRSQPRSSKAASTTSPDDFKLEPQTPEPEPIPSPAYDEIAAAWNAASDAFDGRGLPKVVGRLKKKRQGLAREAWDTVFELELPIPYMQNGMSASEAGLAALRELFDRANASSFLRGETSNKNWRGTFDFVLVPEKFQALIEGAYDDRSEEKGDNPVVLDNELDHRLYAELLREYGEERVAGVVAELQANMPSHVRPYVSKVSRALKERFGGGSTTGHTRNERRPGETHLEHYDRTHEIESDFDSKVAFFRDLGQELPGVWAERAQERDEAARLDELERQQRAGRVIDAEVHVVSDEQASGDVADTQHTPYSGVPQFDMPSWAR